MKIVPHKSPLLRTCITLTHPVTGGLVAASVAAAKLSATIGKLLEQAGLKVDGRWLALMLAGLLGFGVGYGSVASLWWLRWRAIVLLLRYHGWMYDQSSTSTKLWGILLKLLVGPGPHGTYDFQDALPRLPLPKLDDTCNRYLKTVKPLLSKNEYDNTEKLMNDLLQKDGPILQQYLLKRYGEKRNWLADWWLDSAYLMRRDPIAINVNFYMISDVKPEVSKNPVARASNVLNIVMKYWEALKTNEYPPDMILGFLPVCMDGVRYLFASVREPGINGDTIKQYINSKHIIVIRNGVFYKVYMYAKGESGHETVISRTELRNQFQYIYDNTEENPMEPPVAVLTSQDRTTWAKHREMLKQHPVNAATLHDIESAIFIEVLGEDVKDYSDQSKRSLTGNGYSRWFDKSITMEMFGQSTAGGCNMEHAGADATHFAQFWEKALQYEEYGPDGDIVPETTPPRHLPPPTRLHWVLDDKLLAIVKQVYEDYTKQIDAMDCIMFHTKLAKRWMKSKGVSPDGMMQMAIQLAFWRMHKSFTKTYEPASTRLFALGRTDNINPVSEESVRWVRMMDDPDISNADKVKALKAAIAYQSSSKVDCTAGYGCDRHMLGLYLAARELGRDPPAIFRDKSWMLPMKLSTSQVPTQMARYKHIPIVPESIGGGFGPTSPDGYGILYVFYGEELVSINITSWRTCPETDSQKFSQYLLASLDDIKHTMEDTPKKVDGTLHAGKL